MNPLIELQKMLLQKTATRQLGKVVQVKGDTLIVSIGNGTTRVRNTTNTVYKIDDLVSVQGGILLGRAGSGLKPLVFKV